MKKFIVSLSAVAALLAVLLTAVPTRGQSGASAADAPHKVGLIDMAYVFNNYDKFKAMQQGLQEEFKKAQAKAQGTVEDIKKLNAQLQGGTLKPDSPEYKQIEQQSIRLQTELQAYSQVTQREQLRKEAEVYKQVYLEVSDAIRIYAVHFGYTLVLRFDREAVDDAQDPQQILQRMTRQVVYHQGRNDFTTEILKHLNDTYAKSVGTGVQPAAARPAAPATR